jgi:hypothetical protein
MRLVVLTDDVGPTFMVGLSPPLMIFAVNSRPSVKSLEAFKKLTRRRTQTSICVFW